MSVGDDITPQQCREARRHLLNWSMVRLGARSNLSETAIRNFEERLRVMPANSRAAIRAALEAAGVIFDEDMGVRLKKAPSVVRATWDPPPKR